MRPSMARHRHRSMMANAAYRAINDRLRGCSRRPRRVSVFRPVIYLFGVAAVHGLLGASRLSSLPRLPNAHLSASRLARPPDDLVSRGGGMVIQHGGPNSSGDSGQHLDHFTAPEYTYGAP